MFHGKNPETSVGALPPELAHASRYSINQRRGLMFQSFSVAKIENSRIGSRPDHSDSLPE